MGDTFFFSTEKSLTMFLTRHLYASYPHGFVRIPPINEYLTSFTKNTFLTFYLLILWSHPSPTEDVNYLEMNNLHFKTYFLTLTDRKMWDTCFIQRVQQVNPSSLKDLMILSSMTVNGNLFFIWFMSSPRSCWVNKVAFIVPPTPWTSTSKVVIILGDIEHVFVHGPV